MTVSSTLSPNAEAKDADAYPLPLVDYAVSPGEALADQTRQSRLISFLTYATTTGQGTDLAPGVFPLTDALKAAASCPSCVRTWIQASARRCI